jgi:hypothetical protein
VAHERLKEMALALSRPDRDPVRSPRADDAESGSDDDSLASSGATLDAKPGTAAPAEEQEKRPLKPLADLPGRLVLSKAGGESVRRSISEPLALRRPRPSASISVRGRNRPDAAPEGAATTDAEAIGADPTGGNGASQAASAEPRRKMVRRPRKTKDGLPEGWVVDEDGYVVPRHD